MVLLRESGMTQPAIAEAMGVSLSTINRAHMTYDTGGVKALKSKPSGGRQRESMTLAQDMWTTQARSGSRQSQGRASR
jgi:transposase